MKFAVIGPTYPFRGGIAHYTTLLVNHLRRRHDVRFISYTHQYPSWLYPGNTAMDPSPESSVLRIDCERVLSPLNPLTWWRAFRMVQKYKPDVMLLQWWTPFWTPMLFFLTRMLHRYMPQTRIIFICHHIIAPDGGIFDWFLARRILWRAHSFIVMSEEDFALLRRALPGARIRGTLLPPFDVFSRTPIPQPEARASLKLQSDDHVLLFFGFIRRYKGLRYLLDSMALVQQEMRVRLLVVGEFWEDERPYREQVRQLGLQDSVTFYSGYVPNDAIATYFCAADAVVLPYLEATQSGIAQVAIGFEKPLIATDVGGIADVVEHERTGLLVPKADTAAMAAAIVRYFRDGLEPGLSRNIREVKESASWLPLVTLIEELSVPPSVPSIEVVATSLASPRVF